MGRAPGPDDLIVPLPPDAAERRTKRKGEPFRTTHLRLSITYQSGMADYRGRVRCKASRACDVLAA